MSVVIITGSAGLIGSETARRFAAEGHTIAGIDNDMRARFFGPDASTSWSRKSLQNDLDNYHHHDVDVRNLDVLREVFREYEGEIALIVHTAAQPSHDWAAREPLTDFGINALGTANVLELARRYAPDAPFIFTSTNKVYGDTPNRLPLIEHDTRYELDPAHPYAVHGIDESMSIDQTLHSVFGASKVAADVLVQEYGRYFGMKTVCFRGGCLTGPDHAGAELHGFLSYLMKCAITGAEYRIYGYRGKQVRDNIHARDLVEAFTAFFKAPRSGAVYNIGGGRFANCSMTEAIAACEEIVGKKMRTTYVDSPRTGDHIWWISDLRRFQHDYPTWKLNCGIRSTLEEIYQGHEARLGNATAK
ncbi:MAG: NAD-dependent epimerase/dehydratase family protein [Candidatus Hydrogenedentota bacterium]